LELAGVAAGGDSPEQRSAARAPRRSCNQPVDTVGRLIANIGF